MKAKALVRSDSIRALRPALEIDFVADFTCPWSWLSKRRLERALENVQGLGRPEVRWHAFLVAPPSGVGPAWRDRLAARLPEGLTVDEAEQSLVDAGRELGIHFAFGSLGEVPDTSEAHRLVKLAAREGRHVEIADTLFSAWFEAARDIGSRSVLATLGAEAELSAHTLDLFRLTEQGATEVARDDERLRALGVVATPNLLLNGNVLVTGPADIDTYLQALDQALFPQLADADDGRVPTLH